MNVFWRELKAYQKSTIIWVVSLSVLVVVFLLMFTAFTNDIETSRKLISNLPLALRNAFDISLKNFFTIYGFVGYLLTFVGLAGAIQAMSLGVGVLSKEDSGKTSDFLLTKPIKRTKILTNKLLAIICLLLLTNVVFSTVALVTAKIVSETLFSSTTFLLILGTLFLIQLIFMSLGLIISVIIPKIKSASTVALPTVFIFFIVGTVGKILEIDEIKYVVPFKFYDVNYIISHNAYEVKFLIIESVFIILAIIATYIIYVKKDIKAPV